MNPSTLFRGNNTARRRLANRLRMETSVVSMSFKWRSLRHAVEDLMQLIPTHLGDQSQAAETFRTETEIGLLNAQRVKDSAVDYWHNCSLPCPERPKRLVPNEDLASFETYMQGMVRDFLRAVNPLRRPCQAVAMMIIEDPEKITLLMDELRQGDYSIEWRILPHRSFGRTERGKRTASPANDPWALEALHLAETEFAELLEKRLSELCRSLLPTGIALRKLHSLLSRYRKSPFHADAELDDFMNRGHSVIAGLLPEEVTQTRPLQAIRMLQNDVSTWLAERGETSV